MGRTLNLAVFCALFAVATACGSDSETLAIVPEIERRSSNYSAFFDAPDAPLVDDKYLKSDWYKAFESGLQYKMVDSSNIPLTLYCGTYFPVILKNSHPNLTEGEEVDVETCIVTGISCEDENTIKIRRCNGAYEYYLKGTSLNSAYCFDLDDQSLARPVYTIPGDIILTPDMVYVERDSTVHRGQKERDPYLLFSCSLTTVEDYFYHIAWYINNQLAYEPDPVRHTEMGSTNLTEDILLEKNYTLGITIKCGASVSVREDGLRTEIQFSSDFFAGIKIHLTDSQLNIGAGEQGVFLLENTVPIGCPEIIRPPPNCGVYVQMYDPFDHYDCDDTGLAAAVNLDDSDTCGSLIPALLYSEWQETKEFGTYRNQQCQRTDCYDHILKTVNMTITTKNDGDFGGRNKFTVKLITSHTHRLWDNYKISDIQVLVHDDGTWVNSVCFSHTDPWQQTADGVFFFHEAEAGDYILYNNLEYPIQIQERIRECHWGWFCVCGVIIRAGGDMFEINQCDNANFIDFIACEDNILEAQEVDDWTYRIFTPIGTYVEVWFWLEGSLNIDIYLAPKDKRNIEGICGSFDDDPANDLTLRYETEPDDGTDITVEFLDLDTVDFTKSWQIGADESYFEAANREQPRWPFTHMLCVCPFLQYENGTRLNQNNEDEPNYNQALCSPSETLTCTVSYERAGNRRDCKTISKRRRRKRSTSKHETESTSTTHHKTKRSSGKTVAELFAEGFEDCSQYYSQSSIVQNFKNGMLNTNLLNMSITECAGDYVAVGTEVSPGVKQVDIITVTLRQETEYYIFSVNLMNFYTRFLGKAFLYGVNSDEIKASHLASWEQRSANDMSRNKTFRTENPSVVQSYREAHCPNDCYGNGVCNNGTCSCTTGFVGKSCSIDLNAPVNIRRVDGGPYCDRYTDSCNCFYVEARGIVTSTQTRVNVKKIAVGNALTDITDEFTQTGERISIFEIYVCLESFGKRKKRSPAESNTDLVTRIDIDLTNDGSTYGTSTTIFVYDSQCQEYTVSESGIPSFKIKENACYINEICYQKGDTQAADTCTVCDPVIDIFNWTNSCIEPTQTEDTENVALIVGISVAAVAVVIFFVTLFVFKHFNKRICSTYPDVYRGTSMASISLAVAQSTSLESTCELRREATDIKEKRF